MQQEHDAPFVNGWNEYKERVLYQLDELNTKSDKIEKKIEDLKNDMINKMDSLKSDVLVLKVKAAMMGGAAGLALSAASIVIQYFMNRG